MNINNINKEINNIEIKSFLKEWLKNTNEEISISTEENEIKINQQFLINFYNEFLNSFLINRKNCIIFGVDKVKDFKIHISNIEILPSICQDIWDHPEKYYIKENKNENEYYEFLKFLWVKTYDRERRLTDLIKSNNAI